VNEAHLTYLASDDWAERLRSDLLPWVERVGDLGDDVLEVGPGPGRTTDLLRARCTRVTAIELDPALAAGLRERLAGTNVDVVQADAADTGLPDGRFSAAACFSMLHHVPSAEHQDRVFAELGRLLRPGGYLLVADAVEHAVLREFHADDTFVPIDPTTVTTRLTAAGFTDVQVDAGEYEFRLHARRATVAGRG
jgi:SAM-dependent methyltransferase